MYPWLYFLNVLDFNYVHSEAMRLFGDQNNIVIGIRKTPNERYKDLIIFLFYAEGFLCSYVV